MQVEVRQAPTDGCGMGECVMGRPALLSVQLLLNCVCSFHFDPMSLSSQLPAPSGSSLTDRRMDEV